MKILYVGRERRDAQAAAAALRAVAHDVTVSWAPRLDQLERWIHQQTDLAALIVEAQACASADLVVLARLREQATALAIVLIENDNSIRDLPVAVTRALAESRVREQEAIVRHERAARAKLERDLAEARATLESADRNYRAAIAAEAEQAAKDRARYEIAIARAAATRQMVDEQLRDAAIQLERSRRDHTTAAANVERLSQRELDLSTLLADATATRVVLEQRLTDAAAALEAANAQSAEELSAVAGQLAEQRRDLGAEIAQLDAALRDARQDLQSHSEQIARTEAALQRTRHDHAAAVAALDRAAEREIALQEQLAQERDARDAVAQRLADGDVALEHARRDHDAAIANIDRLTRREADLSSRLADLEAERERLESELADAAAAIEHADERETLLTDQLAQGRAAHREVIERLAETGAALDRVRGEHDDATATIQQLTHREADLSSRLAALEASRDRLASELDDAVAALARADGREAALHDELRQQQTTNASLTETIEALRRRALEQAALAHTRLAGQRLATEVQLAAMHERHQRATAERDALQQSLAAAQEELRRLDRAYSDAGVELAERDRDLAKAHSDIAARDRDLAQAHSDIAARDRDLAQAQSEVVARDRELAQRHGEIAALRRQLDHSRTDSDRRFQHSAVAVLRCTRDGALIDANRAWTALVRRDIEELRGEEFGVATLESPNDLSWLIDQSLTTGSNASIETTVRRKDGARLFVRLSACAVSDIIEITAEDLTRYRVLEDRLAQASRMEAVGRVASEVALTCGGVLNDVQHRVRQWVKDTGAMAGAHHDSRVLLDELTRAAACLQQLVAYGAAQTRTPASVDLHTVVRDLAPVLRRVAGDNVDVQLPGKSSSLTVDVDTERVERVLVNLAAYGRERMPFGGRLTIDVATSIVDRHFTSRYPHVRPGPHALITVTEVRRPEQADGVLQLRGERAGQLRGGDGRKPTVDLVTLQGLVGECGGHLWMKVQPMGEIVAKIRLPLRTSYDDGDARALTGVAGRARTLARWFHH